MELFPSQFSTVSSLTPDNAPHRSWTPRRSSARAIDEMQTRKTICMTSRRRSRSSSAGTAGLPAQAAPFNCKARYVGIKHEDVAHELSPNSFRSERGVFKGTFGHATCSIRSFWTESNHPIVRRDEQAYPFVLALAFRSARRHHRRSSIAHPVSSRFPNNETHSNS